MPLDFEMCNARRVEKRKRLQETRLQWRQQAFQRTKRYYPPMMFGSEVIGGEKMGDDDISRPDPQSCDPIAPRFCS